LHGPGSKTLVERWTFSKLLDPASDLRVVIPLFQRAYCWNTSTTVPAWWRDTSNASSHSCGKLMFKQHDGAWWCLDGQQRVTTTMLLVAAARDALLRLGKRNANLHIDEAVSTLNSVLFMNVNDAHAFAATRSHVAKGQRLLFSRLIPSFCDRQHFFELIVGGMVTGDGTDEWMSESTRHSIQFDTKHYFDEQFQQIIDSNNRSTEALRIIASRADAALHMQLMMIEVQSSVNLAQVYQWLQEKSLLSMGALLFNPTPGMNMHACDLTRNLFLSPWTGESLDAQESLHAQFWLAPIELPCGGSPERIDEVLHELVESRGKDVQQSRETERTLLEVAKSPAFGKQDLKGLFLYAKVLSLWEGLEDSLRGEYEDAIQRQRLVSVDMMQRMAAIVVAV
jgi:Protein of unknown function DUF262